ncbi:MAG: efflux RND transporter periplasmic adaptor subunit [Halothiobacillaceae bacterium]|nr:efflux RND transporter periplasmic adaptor subunit [Halothiobacillaceae bacterium]
MGVRQGLGWTGALLCAGGFLLAGCKSKAPETTEAGPPVVAVATVVQGAQSLTSLTGVVKARHEAELGFRVAGKILNRAVDVGQRVEAGEVLLRLDEADARLALAALDAEVNAASAEAERAQAEARRMENLVREHQVSHSEHERARAAYQAAEAQWRAAQARRRQAANALGYAVLVADAPGVVTAVSGEAGQVVQAGQPVVTLTYAGGREVEVHVPESLLARLPEQAVARGYPAGAASAAQRRLLSDRADSLTRTYMARYTLEGALAEAPLGATVTLDFPLAQPRLRVPLTALFEAGRGAGVWSVDAEDRVHWQAVRVLHIDEETAQIETTLPVGARIVALGVNRLQEGQVVRPRPLAGMDREGGA